MVKLTSIADFRAGVPVSLATVFRMIRSGELQTVKVGRRRFITNLDEYLADLESKQSGEVRP